jgi:hypothetical protein
MIFEDLHLLLLHQVLLTLLIFLLLSWVGLLFFVLFSVAFLRLCDDDGGDDDA